MQGIQTSRHWIESSPDVRPRDIKGTQEGASHQGPLQCMLLPELPRNILESHLLSGILLEPLQHLKLPDGLELISLADRCHLSLTFSVLGRRFGDAANTSANEHFPDEQDRQRLPCPLTRTKHGMSSLLADKSATLSYESRGWAHEQRMHLSTSGFSTNAASDPNLR